MRTTVENRKSLTYSLSLEGANISTTRNQKDNTALTRGCFYDFAAPKRAVFSRYSEKRVAVSLMYYLKTLNVSKIANARLYYTGGFLFA